MFSFVNISLSSALLIYIAHVERHLISALHFFCRSTQQMNIDDIKNQNLIILECISGSRAYGLDTKNSDTDIKGVFVLPKNQFYGFDYIPQISNESNDIVYYWVDLCSCCH